MELDNVETVANDLLLRAEFCHGSINFAEANYEVKPVVDAIQDICVKWVSWINNDEKALWQSLLTREVLLTGGL